MTPPKQAPREFWLQIAKDTWRAMAVAEVFVWLKQIPEHYTGEHVHVVEISALLEAQAERDEARAEVERLKSWYTNEACKYQAKGELLAECTTALGYIHNRCRMQQTGPELDAHVRAAIALGKLKALKCGGGG